MQPHEIAWFILDEHRKPVPSKSVLDDLMEELLDLVDPDEAKRLIAQAAHEPAPQFLN